MEAEEIQTQAYKFSIIGNGRNDSTKISLKDPYPDYKEDGDLLQQLLKRASANSTGGLGGDNSGANRLRGWDHSSRIIRISSVSGGKDRHSKVWTSKGLRDRRVRLSVTTAIQFYDLQDRLGYDQPSKAVEWLIKAAAAAIAELPSLNSSFPDTPKQLSEEKSASEGTDPQGFESVEVDGDPNYQQNQSQDLSLLKSACGSNSETSKGLGFSQGTSPTGSSQPNEEPNFFHKATTARPWPTAAPMDYVNPGLLWPSSSRPHHFSGQIQMGNSNSIPQAMLIPPFNVYNENHEEMQRFSFVPDHLIPVTATQPGSGGDYNLNFTISSGLAGFDRVTLQSNSSPSLLPHLQMFGSSSPIDGPNVPFLIITTPQVENHQHHHHFPAGFDGRLQFCYGDGSRHSDQKGKGKN